MCVDRTAARSLLSLEVECCFQFMPTVFSNECGGGGGGPFVLLSAIIKANIETDHTISISNPFRNTTPPSSLSSSERRRRRRRRRSKNAPSQIVWTTVRVPGAVVVVGLRLSIHVFAVVQMAHYIPSQQQQQQQRVSDAAAVLRSMFFFYFQSFPSDLPPHSVVTAMRRRRILVAT